MYSDEKLDTIFKTTIYGIKIHMYIYTYFNNRHIDTLYIYDKSQPFLTARFPQLRNIYNENKSEHDYT